MLAAGGVVAHAGLRRSLCLLCSAAGGRGDTESHMPCFLRRRIPCCALCCTGGRAGACLVRKPERWRCTTTDWDGAPLCDTWPPTPEALRGGRCAAAARRARLRRAPGPVLGEPAHRARRGAAAGRRRPVRAAGGPAAGRVRGGAVAGVDRGGAPQDRVGYRSRGSWFRYGRALGPAVCETPTYSSCQDTALKLLRPRKLRRLAPPGPAITLPGSCTRSPWAPQERARAAGRAAAGRAGPARLLAALWRAFGGPFLRLGGLKLCNDALNFAGASPNVFIPGLLQPRAAVRGRRRASHAACASLPCPATGQRLLWHMRHCRGKRHPPSAPNDHLSARGHS